MAWVEVIYYGKYNYTVMHLSVGLDIVLEETSFKIT